MNSSECIMGIFLRKSTQSNSIKPLTKTKLKTAGLTITDGIYGVIKQRSFALKIRQHTGAALLAGLLPRASRTYSQLLNRAKGNQSASGLKCKNREASRLCECPHTMIKGNKKMTLVLIMQQGYIFMTDLTFCCKMLYVNFALINIMIHFHTRLTHLHTSAIIPTQPSSLI